MNASRLRRSLWPIDGGPAAPHGRPMVLVHASCVALEGRGVLLRGSPGVGKSDLALRLIEGGARLVADDQVVLTSGGETLLAAPPPRIAGLLEVRGIGIVSMDFVPQSPVCLVVDLVPPESVERMPEPATVDVSGHRVRRVALAPFEASTPAKIRLALASVAQHALAAPSAG